MVIKNLILLALLSASGLSYGLTGHITDSKGNPIAEATVDIISSHRQANSDLNGRFKIDVDSAKVNEIHIKAKGYSHRILRLHGQQTTALTVVLQRSAIEHVDVIGLPLHASTMESSQPITVIHGEELRSKQAGTLGDTLKNEVGVHSSYFGPVASSPIIRGLGGPRVLITQNGLDVSDASRIGPDHMVTTETNTAERIEILRGPATLFYGSGAIGGVVNVIDNRVPRSGESQTEFSITHNSVANEDEIALAYNGGNTHFGFHIDGFWRDGDDYKIPGPAALETEQEHQPHAPHNDSVLANSAVSSEGFNLGGSWLFDNGYVGLSYGRIDRVNGIPGHVHGDAHEDETVQSDMTQQRWQLISEITLEQTLFSGINTRIGYTDYQHMELDNGEPGTVFSNETIQARIDFLLQEMHGWRGAVSTEAKTNDFSAVGEEAFTPPSTTRSLALALLEEKHSGNILWQLGARIEKVWLQADTIEWPQAHDAGAEETHQQLQFNDEDFNVFSLSAGLVWDFSADYNIGVGVTHSQRAPTAAELFSAGPHLGTSSYDLGAVFNLHDEADAHLEYTGNADQEVANNIDLSLRKHQGEVGYVLNFFYNQVDDFYYQRNTGYTSEQLFSHDGGAHDHDDALPVYIFEQADARFYGFEAQVAWQLSQPYKLTLWADSIRGKLASGGNLPRVPPTRLGSQLQYQHQGWAAELAATHYFKQSKTAAFETTTDSYTLLDAQLAYTFASTASDLTVFIKGNNLSNEEARVHTSFVKDYAPLPGRGFSVGLRGIF